MAAYVVLPTRRQWEAFLDLMGRIRAGAIVVSPPMQRKLRRAGLKVHDGVLIDYDFGGEPDVMVDVVTCPDHAAVEAIRESLAAGAKGRPGRCERSSHDGR